MDDELVPTRVLATGLHLARFVMADHPRAVEHHIADEVDRALLRTEPGRRAIIEVVLAEDADEHAFFVIDGSTVRTTTLLPSWAGEVEIQRLVESPDRTRWLRAARALGDAFPVDVDRFQSYYDTTTEQAASTQALGTAVGFTRADLATALGSPSAARRGAEAGLAALQRAYHSFELCGAEVARMTAVLTLIATCPIPARLLTLGTVGAVLDPEAALRLADEPAVAADAWPEFLRGRGARLVPIDDVGYYVTLVGTRGIALVESAHDVADTLRDHGDAVLDAARHVTAIEEHYARLYDAMRWYLAADTVYGFLEHLYSEVAPQEPRLPGLRAERVICEERRVTILASLFAATGHSPYMHNVTDSRKLWDLLATLRGLAAPGAEAVLHDLTLRLVIPRFLRDIGLGWVRLGSHETYGDGVTLLQTTIARLRADLARHLSMLVEPNYVAVAHDCLVVGAEQAGRAGDSARVVAARAEAAAAVGAAVRERAQD